MEPLLPEDITPAAIYSKLSSAIKGQEEGKRHLSVILSMHLAWFNGNNSRFRSPNALLIGPTGVGKTHSIRTAASYLQLPYVITDATSLVPSGVVGLQMEDIIEDLVNQAGMILRAGGFSRSQDDDLALARRGIVFIDEFDKLRFDSEQSTDGVLNRYVQRRLLKLTDGATMAVGTRQHSMMKNPRTIDSSGILLIASGVFNGISDPEIFAQRPEALAHLATRENEPLSIDLVNFGFLPELVARFPLLVHYGELTVDDLYEILSDDDTSPVAMWKEYLASRGSHLYIDDAALHWIADQAHGLTMGARGLQQVLFPVLADISYNLDSEPHEEIKLTIESFQHFDRPL